MLDSLAAQIYVAATLRGQHLSRPKLSTDHPYTRGYSTFQSRKGVVIMGEKDRGKKHLRLDQLHDKLQKADKRAPRRKELEHADRRAMSNQAGFASALKLSSEFVAAILVGAAIGYAIDTLAGTLPLAMIVFLMLGFVAGVFNVMRSSGTMVDPHAGTKIGSDDDAAKPGSK